MFRKMFALSKKGSEDLIKATLACTVSNLALTIPFVLLMVLADKLMAPLAGGGAKTLSLWFYTGLAAVLVCIIFLFYRLCYRLTYLTTYTESSNRRTRLAEKIRRLPLSFFGEKNLSDLANTIMNDCTALEFAFSDAIPQFFGSVISALAMGVILFLFDWRMAASLFITFPIAIVLVAVGKKHQDVLSANNMDAESSTSDEVQEYLEGIKVIKACNMIQTCGKELDMQLDSVVKASTRMAFGAGKYVFTAESILRLGLAFAVITGAYLLAKEQINTITYFIFLAAASVVYEPLSAGLKQVSMLFEALVRIDRMKELENQPVQGGETECTLSHYDIEFQDVSFSYKREEILHNVSFTAKQGQVTALVGPSGSGKSTIAKLAARFWDVQEGSVMIGGRDVKTIEPEILLANFSIVFQDVVLFNDTLFNNIKIGKINASKEEVLAAAKAARCDEFIRRFPLGYDTTIGENGSTLSGGERQRISIARALLKDAPIVLLDEATASLDPDNEASVQQAISTLIENKTVLVIVHHLRTIAGADKIIVLDKGQVAEQGSHAELLKNRSLYHALLTA